ncbi:MAG: class I SAM-dependent methyltransferase [Planctomycetes bacterium]|nr:class I SAM-dependent methyltransferase [Planctomycetota bacterium]
MDNKGSYRGETIHIYARLIDPLVRPLRRRVTKMCLELGLNRVLDVGSATGEQCRYLDRAGITVTGLDLSSDMIAWSRRHSNSSIDYMLGSAYALPFPDRSFNGVLLILALHEHSPQEQGQMLSEVLRVLEENGTLVLAEYSFRRDVPWSTRMGIEFIERLAGRDHHRNFRAFLRRGGIPHLLESFPLSIVKQDAVFSGAIDIIAARLRDRS